MQERIEKTRIAILKILKEENKPVSSQRIAEKLMGLGYAIPDRTIRFNLLAVKGIHQEVTVGLLRI